MVANRNEVNQRLRGLLQGVNELGGKGDPDDLDPVRRLIEQMMEPLQSPDFRSALATGLAEFGRRHPALAGSDLGRQMVDIQTDYESASFDRSPWSDIPGH